MVNFRQSKGRLPETIDELSDPISGFQIPTDPETGGQYTYKKTGNVSFKLCADFNLPSDDSVASKGYYDEFGLDGNWSHKEGTECFDRTIDPEKYPFPQPQSLH